MTSETMSTIKFQVVSYAKAQLEYYGRRVELEVDTLEELEAKIGESEYLTDGIHGQLDRVFHVERTDGQEVY